MDRTREGTGFGLNPLQPVQIAAWFRLRGIAPLPWHLDAIERLDTTRMRIYFEKREKESQRSATPEVNERPLTSKLFDAIFGRKG